MNEKYPRGQKDKREKGKSLCKRQSCKCNNHEINEKILHGEAFKFYDIYSGLNE